MMESMHRQPHLRPVPETAPRVLGAVRQSKERDGTISPETQRTAIGDYSGGRGYQVTGWVEGLDESGSRARSAWWPTLERAVAAVEAGEYDGIVVWKFSRVARHRLKWAEAIERVEAVGGFIESATEQFDTTTSSGRLARGMIGELNAFMAEQIGEGWKEAHAARVRAGRPANGKPRFGYLYDTEQKLHLPDPVTGPVLADLYARYVAGESVYALVRYLNTRGHRTTAGQLWSDRSLRRVLDSGFASGQFLAGGDAKRKIAPTLHKGVHKPLISLDLWQAYLDAREGRRSAPPSRPRSQYTLSGLVRCGKCGTPMVAGQFGHARAAKYRCKTAKEKGPEVCAGGYVMASFVEARVLDWLRELAEELDSSRAAQAMAVARQASVKTEIRRLEQAVRKVEGALSRLVLDQAETPSPQSVYRQAHAELTDQLQGLEAVLEEARRRDRRTVLDPGRVAAGLLAEWEERPAEFRRAELATILRHVTVWTGRPRARVRIVPTWEDDASSG